MMKHSWQALVNLLGGKAFRIERIRIAESEIAVEGDFTPPPLACLTVDDQMFVSAFLASHGSIKKMEAMFGISYPTVKNRLNRIAAGLDVPKVEFGPEVGLGFRKDILEKLDRGELSFDEAMEALK
jgi:hypothetical protein